MRPQTLIPLMPLQGRKENEDKKYKGKINAEKGMRSTCVPTGLRRERNYGEARFMETEEKMCENV